jgi:5'-3' exonuclease
MSWTKPTPALVVDGMSMFHSVAGPAAKLTNGYTYSFLVSLTSAVKKFKPRGIFVCWDGGSEKRLALHPGYKANRESSMNDTKQRYLDDIKRFLHAAGVDQLWAQGQEADDIGAMLANTLESAVLVSRDKDWLQLVRPGISIYFPCRLEGRKAEKKEVTSANFSSLTGWGNPEELVRGLCAMGDSVDGIDGIYGIGDATIKSYLMGGLKENFSSFKKLEEFFNDSDLYLRNKALIDLRDIKEIANLELTPGNFDADAVKSLLEEFTFASMLKKFPEWVQPYREASLSADIPSLS